MIASGMTSFAGNPWTSGAHAFAEVMAVSVAIGLLIGASLREGRTVNGGIHRRRRARTGAAPTGPELRDAGGDTPLSASPQIYAITRSFTWSTHCGGFPSQSAQTRTRPG